MTTKQYQLQRKLKSIRNHFIAIDEIISNLPNEQYEKILDFHNPDATLMYCARWGLTGSEELLKIPINKICDE